MLKYILPLIPCHELYVEPFVGGGALFWRKPMAPVSAINDIDGRLVNFYRVLATHREALVAEVRATPYSQSEYRRARAAIKSEDASSLRKAWAYWVLTQMSFANKYAGGWGHAKAIGCSQPQSFKNRKARIYTLDPARLEACEIWCDDAIKVMDRKDCAHAFHYVDPPYVSSHQGHYAGYTREDWNGLLAKLETLQGKWILSSYDEPGLSDWTAARGYSRRSFEKAQSVSHGNRGRKKEVLTMNYIPEARG